MSDATVSLARLPEDDETEPLIRQAVTEVLKPWGGIEGLVPRRTGVAQAESDFVSAAQVGFDHLAAVDARVGANVP